MPKVQITETYKYSPVDSTMNNFTAYIPVKGIVDADGYVKKTEPKLYTSYSQLVADNYKNLDYTKIQKYDDKEYNYLMARKLLEKGLPVVLEGVDNILKDASVTLSGESAITAELSFRGIVSDGKTEPTNYYKYVVNSSVIPSGSSSLVIEGYTFYTKEDLNIATTAINIYTDIIVTTPEVVGTVTKGSDAIYTLSSDKIKDKSLYNIRFLTLGTYINKENTQQILRLANERKDCIALIDHPYDLSGVTVKEKYANVSKQVGKVRSYFEEVIEYEDPITSDTIQLGNDILKNGAGFTPWINVTLNTIDAETDSTSVETKIDVPMSFGYLSAFATAIKENPEWFAVAGSFRGIVDELNSVTYDYTGAEAEILQARSAVGEVPLDGALDNQGIAINPMCKIIPFGYIINGNRTLYDNEENIVDGVQVISYKAFLNIRNLVCTLVKQLYYASKKYTFEPNSDITYINFKSETTPLLDKMRSGLGIRGYKFTRLATPAKARIKALISIKPIEALEDFDLNIELDDTLDVIE